MQYDIFLSYSSHDSEWAVRLYRRLRRFRVAGRPLRIFFAPAALTVGRSIPHALSEALENCQHLVVIMSPAWLSSEWCRLEQEVATWRDPAATRRVVVPLLLETCSLPTVLQRLQYIDFRDQSRFEASLRELVRALRMSVSKSLEGTASSRQREAILNEPILPWLGFSGPSFDFLWPEMIIDPLVMTRKHPGPRRRLSEWAASFGPIRASSIAIVGEPGAGKTTALRSLMLTGQREIIPERRELLHARDLSAGVQSLVSASANGDSLFGVIVDGLDEVGSERMTETAVALRRLSEADVVTLVASRADFFDRQYDVLKDGLRNLIEVVELGHWQDSDILDFTARYSERIGRAGLVQIIEELLSRVRGARDMLGNPMRLTLLLYLMATGAKLDVSNVQEPYSLYDTFYREWIREERSRGTGGSDPAAIRTAHTEIAHWLNEYKGEVAAPEDVIGDMGEEVVGRLLPDTAFSGLLALSEDDTGSLVLTSFRHETIGEFLIARNILDAFAGPAQPLQRARRVTVGHDINPVVRSGFRVVPQSTIRRYLDNLTRIYQELLPGGAGEGPGPHGFGPQKAERLRQQIIYYIGRMPLHTFPEVLRQAFREEQVPLLRRAAALGAILQGDFAIEKEYMALLDDPAEALLNRSVQMAYFGDVHGDLHTFVDRGQDWPRCRAAIYERFENNGERDIRLRWWDLTTLRSFYQSRSYRDVPSEREAGVLMNVSLSDPESGERTQALRTEHQLLVSELELTGEAARGA